MVEKVKQCTSCKECFPATPEYFYRNKQAKDGLRCYCKKCVRDRYYDAEAKAEYDRQYREENRERILRIKREHYWKNRERLLKKYKIYWENNAARLRRNKRKAFRKRYRNDPEFRKKHNERNKKWREENPWAWEEYYERNSDTIKERARQWEIENPEQKRKRRREWYRKNIKECRLKSRVQSAVYRARKAGAPGEYTDSDISKKYEAQSGKCYYCNESIAGGYHADHVIPLSRGGTNDPSNIVLTCPTCNLSKCDKLPHEWEGTNRIL